MVSTRLRNAAIAAFGLAPRGFDQIAPSRAVRARSIPPGIDLAHPPHDHHDLVESICQLSAGQDTRDSLKKVHAD
jgi:hypothetical protein